MLQRLKNFIFYNNGFVVLVLLVVLSSGSVMAATNPAVRDGVINSEDMLVEIDNSFIRDVNLENHDFRVKITKVEKDDENYYVSYDFNTIELVDGVWKKIVKKDVLTINIEQLGERDLGLYAAEELQELVDATKKFLVEVQIAENENGRTDKTVARTYRGLVGRFLDTDEITFAGYDPVIEPPVIVAAEPTVEPVEREEVPIEEVVAEEPQPEDDSESDEDNDTGTTTEPVVPNDTTAPVLTLIGEALIELTAGESYLEPGATAIDDVNGDITEYIVLSGTVNSGAVGDYVINYSVADAAGNVSNLNREVKVKAVEEPTPLPETETGVTSSST